MFTYEEKEVMARIEGGMGTKEDLQLLLDGVERRKREDRSYREFMRHLTEGMMLVDDARADGAKLNPQEYADVVSRLVAAGDNKISLFSAMKALGRRNVDSSDPSDDENGKT